MLAFPSSAARWCSGRCARCWWRSASTSSNDPRTEPGPSPQEAGNSSSCTRSCPCSSAVSSSQDVLHPSRRKCGKSARGASAGAALSVIYVGIMISAREKTKAPLDCVLCQLWRTTCSQPDPLFRSWSYTVLALLLPASALQTGTKGEALWNRRASKSALHSC
jgi:hypothetical protein